MARSTVRQLHKVGERMLEASPARGHSKTLGDKAMTDEPKTPRKPTQEDCSRLVSREVYHCVSSLVSTLASGYTGNGSSDIENLCEQAMELASPIPDYEEAVRWHVLNDMQRSEIVDMLEARGVEYSGADVTKMLGETLLSDIEESDGFDTFAHDNRIDPQEREVYEHWIVSRWLADKLEARGEKVDRDFAGMVVWARTCTGQAILLDRVIEEICEAMLNA
jgi:hypothetical protein